MNIREEIFELIHAFNHFNDKAYALHRKLEWHCRADWRFENVTIQEGVIE
jgi:hypothetical protein